ncbi:hypothetical protein M9H77_08321 [Catharanthus roseus]|uniref:Uncharacterized protein n=1 Tax=Catharanthus roseus TaxID=4058 RepID=A0ACC0BXF7_CATRO|nr:hypothetical protein M9H77_08321 [Catharanthus roseus]
MSPNRTGPHFFSSFSHSFQFFFQFLSVLFFLSVVAPPPIFLSSSLLFSSLLLLLLLLPLPLLHLQASLLPVSSSSLLLSLHRETTLLCSSPHRTSPHGSHPPTGRHSPRKSTPPHLYAPLYDKYDQSNAAQSSKNAKKSYKSNVWIHTRRLDIGKNRKPRVEYLGYGKVKMRIEERMLSS